MNEVVELNLLGGSRPKDRIYTFRFQSWAFETLIKRCNIIATYILGIHDRVGYDHLVFLLVVLR
jgi:hypothetical protein